MGLREMKAARTRRQIAEVAVSAFIEHGYDETTMEQIAELAEIGTSTLYRYFPSKELLILEPFSEVLDFGHYLRARPADETAGEALAGALLDLADQFSDPSRRIPDIRRIIDASAVPRARLWDIFLDSRAEFEAALAERMGLSQHDHAVQISAGIALDIFYRVDEQWKGDHEKDYRVLFRDALASLSTSPIVLPTIPSRPSPVGDPVL
ncbi:MAG: helix-turn-helix domain-containing protein [Microbacterium sp.]